MHTRFYSSGGGTMRRVLLLLILCLLPVPYAFATCDGTDPCVQDRGATELGSTNTIALAYTSNVTSGDWSVVGVTWQSGNGNLNSVTAGCVSGGYTLLDNPTGAGSNNRAAQAYGKIDSSGACTVTATFSATSTNTRRIKIQEVSGRDSTDALDGASAHAATTASFTTAADNVSSGNMTITSANDYVFCWAFNVSGVTLSAGSGFESDELVSNRASEHAENPGAGNFPCTFTSGTAAEFAVGGMALKPAGGGGTAVPKGLLLGVYP